RSSFIHLISLLPLIVFQNDLFNKFSQSAFRPLNFIGDAAVKLQWNLTGKPFCLHFCFPPSFCFVAAQAYCKRRKKAMTRSNQVSRTNEAHLTSLNPPEY